MLVMSAGALRTGKPLYEAAMALAAAAIFFIDTFTPLTIAIAVLYSVIVMASANLFDRSRVLATAAICAGLTVASYLIVHGWQIVHGASFMGSPFTRALISLSAIAATTALALRNQDAALRLAEQASLLDLTHDAIIVRDMRGVITYWNAGAEDLFGWTRREAVGQLSAELLRTKSTTSVADIRDELERTGRWRGELTQRRKDGSEVVVESRCSLQRSPRGEPLATISTNNDVTEQKRAEDDLAELRRELSHVARVSTLGELTASIAHEVNQPLAAVVANGDAGLRWLSRAEPDLAEARMSVERMIASARRASEVVARLRALARKDAMSRTAFTLNDIVEDVAPLVERELQRASVKLRLDLEPQPLALEGDRVQLQQVAINLLLNAVQAMAGIEDRPRALMARTRNAPEGADGPEVVLEIVDSGVGLDAEAAGRLFAPFFTTKNDGMGMGLSICRTIVEAHGGRIAAAPAEPHGARFTVELPVRREVFA